MKKCKSKCSRMLSPKEEQRLQLLVLLQQVGLKVKRLNLHNKYSLKI